MRVVVVVVAALCLSLAACHAPSDSTSSTGSTNPSSQSVVFPNAGKLDARAVAQSALLGLYGWNWNWLNKLLAGISVDLPDQQFDEDSFVFKLTHLVCNSFQIGDVELSVQGTTVNVDVTGGTGTCTGDFSYEQETIHFPSGSGSLKAQATNSKLLAGIGLGYNASLHLPNSAQLATCTTDISLDLSFSGGITADILNLFKSQISDFIRKSLNDQACSMLKPEVNTDLTNQLLAADAKAVPYLLTPTPTPTPALPSPLVDWRTNKPYNVAFNLVKGVLTPPVVNMLLNSLTNGTSELSFPVNYTATGHDSVLNVTVTFSQATVQNLSSFDALDLIDAFTGVADGVTLHNHVGMTDVGAVLEMALVLDTPTQHVRSNVTAGIALQQFAVDVDQAVAIESSSLGSLRLADAVSAPCLGQALQTLNLTAILPTFKSPPVFTVSGYDPDFDVIVEQTLAMAYGLVDAAVPIAVTNVANGLVKQSVNEFLTHVFGNGGECVQAPRPIAPLVDFREAAWMETVQEWLAMVASPDMLNARVRHETTSTGVVYHPEAIAFPSVRVDAHTTATLTTRNLRVENLDSVEAAGLLEPMPHHPHSLLTTLSLGTPARPVKLSVDMTTTLTNHTANTTAVQDLQLRGSWSNLRFSAATTLQLNATALWAATLGDLATPGLFRSLVHGFAIENATVVAQRAQFAVRDPHAPSTAPPVSEVRQGTLALVDIRSLSAPEVRGAIVKALDALDASGPSLDTVRNVLQALLLLLGA